MNNCFSQFLSINMHNDLLIPSHFPSSLQIECMVATEMMQRYKKLQFERGESMQKQPQYVSDSSSACGQ